MATGTKTAARWAKARERECRAFELRKQGKSYRAIGKELGVSHAAAAKMVKRVLSELDRLTKEEAAEVRRLETERLDAMLEAVWPKAEKGNQDAIDTVLKLQKRRADLWGLDKPTRTVQVTLTAEQLSAMSEEELDATERRLSAGTY